MAKKKAKKKVQKKVRSSVDPKIEGEVSAGPWGIITEQNRKIERATEQVNKLVAAINGEWGDDQAMIAMVGMGFIDLILRKNRNYGSSVFLPPVLSPDMSAQEALMVRMSDKVKRIEQLNSGSVDEVGESLQDTVKDLGAYCLLWLCEQNT